LPGGIPKIGKGENVFNGKATTSGRMDKRRPRLDSPRQIGLSSHPHEILTLVDEVFNGDKVVGAEFRKSERGGMFSMAEPRWVGIWTNGGHSWIQRVK